MAGLTAAGRREVLMRSLAGKERDVGGGARDREASMLAPTFLKDLSGEGIMDGDILSATCA